MALNPREIEGLDADDLRFEFVAGARSLDLVATVGERWSRSFERLRAPADLQRWLVEGGLAATGMRATAGDLEDARRLRSAIHECVEARRAGRTPPSAARTVVNTIAAWPDLAPSLGADWGRTTAGPRSAAAALSCVARDAIDLLASCTAERLRECEAPDCSHLFVDRSRPGLRRWCDARGCGNRSKTAAYRRRRKARLAVKGAEPT